MYSIPFNFQVFFFFLLYCFVLTILNPFHVYTIANAKHTHYEHTKHIQNESFRFSIELQKFPQYNVLVARVCYYI